MIKKNTKFSALRSLAFAGAMGACSVGVSHGAIIYNIEDSGANLMISTVGGTIDLTGETFVYGSAGWPANSLDLRGGPENITGVTNAVAGSSTHGLVGTVVHSAGYSLTNGFASGTWSGIDSFFVLFDRTSTNMYVSNTMVTGVNNIGAGSITSDSNISLAGIGLADGDFITWSSNSTGDTVTFVAGAAVAVPEPSSAVLASAGLGLLAFRRKRK